MGRAHEVRAKKMAQTNAAKSALYNRASKEIYMAAKSGDPDPSSNLALRSAIEKYRGDYSYFEYLLRNPFLLKLKLSIEDPNYHDTILDVFKKHKVKTPKEIIDKVKNKNQEDCISYLQLMKIIIKIENISTPSESNFTFNPYLDDLSLIYKRAKSKLYNYNFVEYETFELDASESQKLIRKK